MFDKAGLDKFAEQVSRALEQALGHLPERFCWSFDYTTTGQNLTPIIVAELAKIVAGEPEVRHVGIDVKVNWQGKCRFQPDVVGFDKDLQPMIFVDYESPNSSDERVIWKDIGPYLRWREMTGNKTPYLVVTTLPAVASPDWQVLYTSDVGYGAAAKGKKELVRANPFEFWASIWRKAPEARSLNGAVILNIDCQSVSRVTFDF
jgi:hypothetical protein